MSPAPAWWSGPYLAACLLVVAAGVAKLGRPEPTAGVLRQAHLRVGPGLVRVGAALEAALGGWALSRSRPAAAGVALSYLGFAGFVAWARRTGSPVSSCGCFGKADVAPTTGHLVLNLAAAALSGWAAVTAHPSLWAFGRSRPLVAVGVVLLGAVIAYLAYLVMTALPRLQLGSGEMP